MPRFLALLGVALSFAWASPDTTAHLLIQDSSQLRWAAVRVSLAESLQVNDFGTMHRQSSTWAGLLAYGELSPRWSWRSSVHVFTDIANFYYPVNDYQPYHGIPYNLQGSIPDSAKHRTWDYITGYTEYRPFDSTMFCAGLDYLHMGPSYRNPVAFRGDQSIFRPWQDTAREIQKPAPIAFVGFDLGLKWISYSQYSGKLEEKNTLDKYIHTHRLTFHLPGNSEFGLSETELYGTSVKPYTTQKGEVDSVGRTMEWLYAMPFIPYYFASHYLGDQDNGAMGFDGIYRGLKHWEFYGELFIDDSKSPLSLFDTTWWGNKWAFSAGSHWFMERGKWKAEWRGEYTRIEPWVYTHYEGLSHQYTNFNQILGSDLGPNSQEIYTHIQVGYDKAQLKLSLSSVAKDTAKGGSISDLHLPTDPTNKVFLNPASTFRYKELGCDMSYAPRSFVWLRLAGYRYWGHFDGYRVESALGLTW